jgi:hypothetical protein
MVALTRPVPAMSTRSIYTLNNVDKVFRKFIVDNNLNNKLLPLPIYVVASARSPWRRSFDEWLFKQGIYVKIENKRPHFAGCSEEELTMFILRHVP